MISELLKKKWARNVTHLLYDNMYLFMEEIYSKYTKTVNIQHKIHLGLKTIVAFNLLVQIYYRTPRTII